MIIHRSDINRVLIGICISLVLFSSACLWNEKNLRNYIAVSFVSIFMCVLIWLVNGANINKAINNRYIIWIVVIYSIFEIYGLCFLRTSHFNWDFVLVSGVIQIALTLSITTLDTYNDVIDVFCTSCKWTLLLVCVYMYFQGTIKLGNISFATRLGDELSGNVNTVATALGIMLIPTFYLLFIKKKKVSTIIICAIAVVCMLLTGSKKGLLVLAIMLIMYFWINQKPIKYLILPLGLIMGIYAIFNVPFLYNTIGFRVIDALATLGFGTSVTGAQSTAIRNDYIKMGMESFLNVPVFGGGMNYFQFINNARYYAHNNYVEMLNDFGLVGTLIYYVPSIKAGKFIMDNIRFKKNIFPRELSIFVILYISTKLILDYAMVSFSALCIFYIPFLIPAEIYRRRYEQDEQNTYDT